MPSRCCPPPGIREIFAALVLLFAPALLPPASAATATLQWASNEEADVAGYLVLYGLKSGQLTESVDVGNHTSYQFTNLEPGRTYFFAVRAYTAGRVLSAPSAEVSATIGVASLMLRTLFANVASPKPAGTKVIFAAAAGGGRSPYQYKWLLFDGARWTTVKDWSTDNTLTWQPLVANARYIVKAWARSVNSAIDGPENGTGERSMPFPITPVDQTTINLAADKEAPQPAGTRIRFTASASGGSTFQYQWSVLNGTSWTVLQDWSSNATFTWTPAAPNAGYQVMVRVRGGQSLVANGSVALRFPIQ